MPTISMFYGILIALFFRDDTQHKVAHIHARYQGFKASLALDDGRVLARELPPR